jgi:prepilin signal peptidase PulO-like enzyme (type II secretory pathway)
MGRVHLWHNQTKPQHLNPMLFALMLWITATAVTARVLEGSPVLPVALAFVAVAAVLIPLDLRARRLPRAVLLGGLGVVFAVQLVAAISIDEPRRIVGSIVGGGVGALAFMVVHRAAPDGPSFGDAAFAALAGGTLGWVGADRVVLGLGLGLVLGAIAAGPITLAVRRDLLTLSPSITLRPAIAAGTWIAMCWGGQFASSYLH